MIQRKKEMKNNMKLIKKEQAEILKNSDTSSLLEYSIALDEKDLDFCVNTITGRYPEKGYCTNEEYKALTNSSLVCASPVC